jgi:hypothetical protein
VCSDCNLLYDDYQQQVAMFRRQFKHLNLTEGTCMVHICPFSTLGVGGSCHKETDSCHEVTDKETDKKIEMCGKCGMDYCQECKDDHTTKRHRFDKPTKATYTYTNCGSHLQAHKDIVKQWKDKKNTATAAAAEV